METKDFIQKMLLIIIPIILLIVGCVIILKVAENITNNIRPTNSLSIYDNSCYVNGDSNYFAVICNEYMLKVRGDMNE